MQSRDNNALAMSAMLSISGCDAVSRLLCPNNVCYGVNIHLSILGCDAVSRL